MSTITQVSSTKSVCPKGCIDGYIVEGWSAKPCSCLKQRQLRSRLKKAMIPEEFEDAELRTYQIGNEVQRILYNATREYLKKFDEIKDTSTNSLGFIAVFGEQKLRAIRKSQERSQMKRKHNNFGLGKTHLQIAAAKQLMRKGYSVICISDVDFMDEVSQARGYDDRGERVNSLIGAVVEAPVLVWDDIGKAKPSEYRLDVYYQIINERYKKRRPILFSSNEDADTLLERIGDAAGSRLLGMSKGNIYAVEGPDYRLKGDSRF